MLANNCLVIKLRSSCRFCGQDEVVTSRSKTVAVAVVVWKELLQDMMLAVPDPFEQTFVGILSDLGSSRITVAIYRPSRTPRRTNVSMRCLSELGEPPPGEAYGSLASTTALHTL